MIALAVIRLAIAFSCLASFLPQSASSQPQTTAASAQAPTADEQTLRTAVQQYFDTLKARDPDAAASFWSADANPRMTRDTFVALFGPPADDTYVVEIRSVAIKGAEARVRVYALRVRLEARDGRSATSRLATLNSQTWRNEARGWKLLRDVPFADELADEYLAMPEAERAKFLAQRSPSDGAALRYAVSQRATMAITLGRNYAAGRALFEQALEISRALGDRVGEANSLHNIAQADYNLREFPAAVEAYNKELEVARAAADDEQAAGALYGLGTVSYATGDYSVALGNYRDALAVYEKRDEASSASRSLISVGNIQYLQADYDGATASYRRAESLAVSAQDPQGAAFARGGLARVLSAQGDLAAALEMYTRVLSDSRAAAAADARLGNGVATTLESIGEVHFRLGNMDQSRAAFDEARRLVDADSDFSARLYSSLGLTELVAGRYDAALSDYVESRARYVKAKDAASASRAWIGVGFAQAAREKWDDAIAAYNSAIQGLEGHDEDRARAWLGLSLAQTGAADQTAALESARKVIGIADALKNQDLAWRGNVRAGEALTKLAQLDDARAAFRRAIDVINVLALEAPANPDARAELSDSAEAWAGLAIAQAKAGDARAALDAAEARRAHVRRMHLAAFSADITRGESDDDRAAEQSLIRDLVATRARLKAETAAPRPDGARVQRLSERLADLTDQRNERQAALYAKLPALAELRGIGPLAGAPPTVDLEALVPDASTLAIEYVLTADELLALVIDRGDAGLQVTSAVLPQKRHSLADDVAAAMKPDVLQDLSAWRKAAEPLRRSLVAPVADRFHNGARCIVVPDDVIWKVPIEALPDGESELGARMRITYATSLATLAMERRQTSSAANPPASADAPQITAAFVAAPAISDAMRAQLAMTQPGWKEPDPMTVLARAQASAKPYGDAGPVKSGADATKIVVRALLGEADVVQISAPFHVSGPVPLFSAILLAPAPGASPPLPGASPPPLVPGASPSPSVPGASPSPSVPGASPPPAPGASPSAPASGSHPAAGAGISPDDLRWEVREWFALQGRTRILVLDDASTFGAAGVAGAIDTLAWAAAAAGVSTIVIARWPADAFALDALEIAFHSEVAKGIAPLDAFQTAVKQVRETSGAPAAWAGLRLIGGA